MAANSTLNSSIHEPALVRIPEGWFYMGSESGQDNERPVHRVWVDSSFLGVYQVTNAEYARYLSDSGVAPPPTWAEPEFSHPRQPVVSVSWFDAVNYCEWLSSTSGSKYRLPTEAEWERA